MILNYMERGGAFKDNTKRNIVTLINQANSLWDVDFHTAEEMLFKANRLYQRFLNLDMEVYDMIDLATRERNKRKGEYLN